ncbi:MAG: aminopeptidase P N-terminal domain-containing protein [Flavobacterium sp.]|nr:aminopeptidase P N-terminal domain-containing protein [Flavobacterium sp.]
MKTILPFFLVLFLATSLLAQNGKPTDYLSNEFHKEKRTALRNKMPKNTVAIFFGNPERNRSNDVDYVYHQDPNFYYLTGYPEPNCVLVIFSENQVSQDGKSFNEILYVQEKDSKREQWTGIRMGVEGAKKKLGFENAFNGKEFLKSGINFQNFETVYFMNFQNDIRDSEKDEANLYKLVESFKNQIGYSTKIAAVNNNNLPNELNSVKQINEKKVRLDTTELENYMADLREIKTDEELNLLAKAARISAIGQIEIMKAMHPGMSETEIQGVHEFVYKKYGSEFEGYPSIVGSGNNGCVLHYIENSKMKVENDLVLMDLGAEYHGYTADVTRTIPANGKFSTEQKLIYDLVYEAQEAGIKTVIIGNNFQVPDQVGRKIITDGLLKLGVIKKASDSRIYFPHGTSHHIGLDVHDPGKYNNFEENMVLTVEPGIYIPIGSDCDKKWWGIAVRIEDDVLVTKKGPINLSIDAPRKSDEIEALMNEKSALDSFVLPKID